MHPEFQSLINQATRLTQSGNLTAATAAIQAALRPGARPVPPHQDDADVIDVQAWEIPDPDAARAPAPSEPIAPEHRPGLRGDTFTAGVFRNAAGQRDYKLYVPPNAGDQPFPLVVMLHGCTQDADDFAAGTAMNDAARTQGFYVLYPVQPREVNPQKCWNWFKHTHQRASSGEPAILAGMTRDVMATHAIDPQRVYVAGLSAGGAMAAILANTHPELYAAVGVHSGLAAGAASDLPSALSAMKGLVMQAPSQAGHGVPTLVFHGDRDTTVHPGNAERVAACAAGAGARIEARHVPGAGHRHDSTKYVYRDAAGTVVAERWEIHGAGHAWAGGSASGSCTDRNGPDATGEMLKFFFARALPGRA